MKHLKLLSLLSTSALIFLSGCASYNASSLNTLTSEAVFSSSVEKKDVIVVAKAFDKADCKRYLDRDVLAEGYQPVQLYIENNSDESYFFSPNKVSLSCARFEEVAKKVHTSTVGRAAGYGAAAWFAFGILTLPISWFAFGTLAVPAVVDGVKSAQANEALDSDFSSKAARDQIILPHSYFNKLLFVPINEYQPNFRITLMEEKSKKIKEVEVVPG